MIHRVTVSQVLPSLTTRQLFTFRMAGDQETARAFGERLRTRWMELNPGYATKLVLDWPTAEELGQHHVMPPTPDVVGLHVVA